jgi:Zn-finger nucleic acid-binding protein
VACPACLALVPLTVEHCPACGAALAARVEAASGGAPCPACAKPLAASRIGDLAFQGCQACGGLWLDRAIFEQLGASRERQGAVLGALPAPPARPTAAMGPAGAALGSVQYRPCPGCGQRMNRVNYARRSGVVLDVCRAHGLWFDRDELRRVLAFIAGGGLDRARQRELEELKEAKRKAVAPPEHAVSSYEFGQQGSAPGHWLTATDLVGLAMDAAGLFLGRP